jgi:hypothetical protein
MGQTQGKQKRWKGVRAEAWERSISDIQPGGGRAAELILHLHHAPRISITYDGMLRSHCYMRQRFHARHREDERWTARELEQILEVRRESVN